MSDNSEDNPKVPNVFNFHGPVVGANFGDGTVEIGNAAGGDLTLVHERMADPAKRQPRHLKSVIGREAQKALLLQAYEQVVASNVGHTVFLMGQYGSGRRALTDWLQAQVEAAGGQYMAATLGPLDPREFATGVRQEAREGPLLLNIDRLELEPSTWIDNLYRLADEIAQKAQRLPVLMVITLTTSLPLEEIHGNAHNEFTRLVQKLSQDGLASATFMHSLTLPDVKSFLAPAELKLAERLFHLSGGDALILEIIWQEWQAVNAVVQDENERWIANPERELTVYGDVYEQARAELEQLLFAWEDDPPFTLAEAEKILNCAATEGEIFTADAVAATLDLDKDELIDFFDEFLLPFVDEESGVEEASGILLEVGAIEIDPYRSVWHYRFARPYLFYVWRCFPALKKERQGWSGQLAQQLETLHYPHTAPIARKLIALFLAANQPERAKPYQEQQSKNVSLAFLRGHVDWLISHDLEQKFNAYRLFEVSFQYLNRLAKEQPGAWQEGVQLAQTLYDWAVFHKDEGYDAEALYYETWNLKNGGQFQTALPKSQKAVELAELYDLPQTDWARFANILGALLLAMGDLAAARPFVERALAIFEKALGSDHQNESLLSSTANSLNNLGGLLQAMGDLAAARPFYERALAIYEKALGPDHPDTALSLNNLGGLLRAMGDLAAARPFYERALAIREKALGPDHPDTAQSLNNLGFLLKAMGDLAAAQPFYERALAIREKALGPDHPSLANSLNNLGLLVDAAWATLGRRVIMWHAPWPSAKKRWGHPSQQQRRRDNLAAIAAKLPPAPRRGGARRLRLPGKRD
ncbi:MAG: tetratricopeptide repeat protein [Anaerolineaceae bacterium]|nr:tetratricopeptide repeat protein [Anaerolineaceae bacterium]